jgi:hypothetical protein
MGDAAVVLLAIPIATPLDCYEQMANSTRTRADAEAGGGAVSSGEIWPI